MKKKQTITAFVLTLLSFTILFKSVKSEPFYSNDINLINSKKTNKGVVSASSASFTDVQAAVNAANHGDTVIVPSTSGSIEWASTLVITKYITLKGSGNDKTTISASGIAANEALIKYIPDEKSRNDNGLFRVTGFTLYPPDGGMGITFANNTTTLINKCRIDNNKFIGGDEGVYFQANSFNVALIDHNYFSGQTHSAVYAVGRNNDSWQNLSLNPGQEGAPHAVYIEDNVVDTVTNLVMGGGHGMAYVARFNDIRNPVDFSFFDSHGNFSQEGQGPIAVRGTRFTEIYRNTLTGIGRATRFEDLRGGKGIIFDNTLDGTTTSRPRIQLREEDEPGAYNTVPSTVSNNGAYYECLQNHTSDANNEPGVGTDWQSFWKEAYDCPRSSTYYTHITTTPWEPDFDYKYSPGYDPVKDTYIWNNTYSINGSDIRPLSVDPNPEEFYIIENRDFWLENNSFDGSGGMGVGTYDQMQAITSAQEGVGFWVTDRGDWNTQGEDGILYRYQNNEWVKFYQPCTYPHPLILLGDKQAPTVPENLTATVTSNSRISLSWNLSTDNIAVVGYRIFRNGSVIDTTSNTTYPDTALTAGTEYSYTLSAFDAAGNESAQCTEVRATTTTTLNMDNLKYSNNDLSVRVYPNPLTNKATIEYTLPKSSEINITLYDCFGQKIRTCVSKHQNTGAHKVELDVSELTTGFYFIKLNACSVEVTKKCMVVK